MTVPKSKVLSVSKGIMALANLTHNSPKVKQNVIVKNYVTPVVKEPETKTRKNRIKQQKSIYSSRRSIT